MPTSEEFEDLTVVLLKMQAFWNVMPCQTINTDVSKDCVASIFRAKQSKNCRKIDHEHEGIMILRNVGAYLRANKA
jgi:hypothetical protein